MDLDDPELDAYLRQVFSTLNHQFYATSPDKYFRQRLANLLTVAAQDDDWGPRLRKGIHVGDLTLKTSENEYVDSDLDADERMQFVIAETEVLEHHIAEVLLRFFIAHAPGPDCPWLELADLRSGEFDEWLEKHFLKQSNVAVMRGATGLLYLGAAVPTEAIPNWDRIVDNLILFMRHFAKHLTEKKDFYNAVKHGFAMNAGNVTLLVGDDAPGTGFSHSGPSVEYLERKASKGGMATYTLTMEMVDLVESWFLSLCGVLMLRSLWSCARWRILEQVQQVSLFLPDGDCNPEGIYAQTRGNKGKMQVTSVAVLRNVDKRKDKGEQSEPSQ